jgi:hypothetical protein
MDEAPAVCAVVQADTDLAILETPSRDIVFGNDPLHVLGLPVRIKDCVFPEPGLYWIQVWYEGRLIAEQDLLLK